MAWSRKKLQTFQCKCGRPKTSRASPLEQIHNQEIVYFRRVEKYTLKVADVYFIIFSSGKNKETTAKC